MKVLLCGIWKGGASKTTSSILITRQLAERGYKVLYIDYDSQRNGTGFISLNSEISSDLIAERNIYKAFQDESLSENIIELEENIDFIAGSQWINQFEMLMNQKKIKDRHLFIRKLLGQLVKEKKYDFCILDMSPTNSALNTAVMAAATHHIVLSESGYFSLKMVPDYISSILALRKRYNVQTTILGISVCLIDSRSKFEKKIVATIKTNYSELVFDTIIRRKALLKNYTAIGYPTKMYKKDKIALAEYSSLTEEILERLGMNKTKESEKIG